jgi:peptidoglycan/LPS O-acetylase OafA/YrhL
MKPSTQHAYRADIDGLRALAVLAVIAFHANANLLRGGFVGVDIFFVISGYLITGIIAKGIEDGNFSFAGFYARRIKRILPAYIVVALATLVIASFLLIPNDYIFYTTSLAASWAFASNVFFSMLSWGYFGQRTEEFPLLHTWSLSVEEQFYFAFPILLIFLFRYFRKHLIPALFALALVFLAISQSTVGEVKSYFLLSSRAHELLIGALTFFLSQKFPIASRTAASLLATLGMGAMLASMFLISRGVPFPGVNSLYPCIGAALVIYAGRIDNAVTPLLKNKLMVSIGLISYSLYLWHWPIFSFLRYRRIEITPEVGMAAVALSFLLAFLTWKFVENPVRHSRRIDFKRAFLQFYVPPAVLCISVGAYSYLTEGAPKRFPDDTRELISSYSYARDLTRSCSIRAEDYKKVSFDYLQDHCAFGDLGRQKAEVLLMGDSHADHFKPFVEQFAGNANLKAVFHVQGSCSPIDLPEPGSSAMEGATTCEKRNADLLALAGQFKYVVLAGFWSGDAHRADLNSDLESGLTRMVREIIRAGATPVVFKDNPHHERDLSQCVLHRKRGWISQDQNCNIPYSFVAQTQGAIDDIIDKVKLRYPQTVIVDPKRIMCNSDECVTYISNTAIYKDANHINTKAAKLLGEQYIARVGNPFVNFRITRHAPVGVERVDLKVTDLTKPK